MNVTNIVINDPVLLRLEPYVILKAYRGSIAHGMYQENLTHDDKDIMGIFVTPEDELFGLGNIETVERMISIPDENGKMILWDVVYYSLRKFLSLVLKQNPNVLTMLWAKPAHYLKTTELGNILISKRAALLSKDVYISFVGYARGQMHRMTSLGPTGQMGAKRKELVSRFGYDIKNAAHLIRLLKMGYEALTEGKLNVFRDKDAAELLEIKRGEWTLERVKEEAEKLFSWLDVSYVNSTLPDHVNYFDVNELCVNMTKDFYGVKL